MLETKRCFSFVYDFVFVTGLFTPALLKQDITKYPLETTNLACPESRRSSASVSAAAKHHRY